MPSAMSQIQSATNATTELQAKTDTVTGAASAKLTSTDFLNLLMKQLQYQDPMAPTDNAQFVSQQCQFAQLSSTQDISSGMSSGQALSLVGKNVTITNPDDASKTITGTVTSTTVKGANSTITINGKEYPASKLISVSEASAATTPTATPATTATN